MPIEADGGIINVLLPETEKSGYPEAVGCWLGLAVVVGSKGVCAG